MDPLENNHKQRRWLIAAIVVVAVVLVVLFFLRRGKGGGGDNYRTEAVSRGNITMTVNATGTLSAVTTVQVGSQVSGIIAKLYADFNSQVKQGQLLAELDPTPFQQTVDQRRADVTKSQVDVANTQVMYNRQKRLSDAGLIAASDLDAAKAAFDGARAGLAQSQAALKQAQTNLGYAKIYSPIDGQVVARAYDIGQTVAASFSAPTLFTIAKDLTKMQVQADVDQSDIGQIKAGEVARFTVDAYPDQEFRGQIAQVRLNATVTQNVITYPVIIEVGNPEGKLRPSMTANVTIEVSTVRGVLRVPNAALRFRPETTGDDKDKKAQSPTPAQSRAQGGQGRSQGQDQSRPDAGETPRQAQAETSPGPGETPGAAEPGRHHHRGGGDLAAGGTPGANAEGASTPGAAGRDSGSQTSFESAAANAGRGGLGGALAGGGGRKGGRQQGQTVYVLSSPSPDKKAELKPVKIRTGVSDGHYTQVVSVMSGELNLGDLVVTGVATIKVEASAGNGPPGGPLGGAAGGGRGGARGRF
ncbi:MAG TPA: efflux RND transporter periplasmic adaptor subunit [Thermoanaerobaculia bacterium]|jgi:HlyD family secretion protein|nr:efflux RND transporter periplasmic adaptor subunit [Thermoanaerobaculia bacterium]